MSGLFQSLFGRHVVPRDPSFGYEISWQSDIMLEVGDTVQINGRPVQIVAIDRHSILPATYKGRFRDHVPQTPLQKRVRAVRHVHSVVRAMLIGECYLLCSEATVLQFVQVVMAAVSVDDCCLRLRLLRAKVLDAEGCRLTQGIGPLLWQARKDFENDSDWFGTLSGPGGERD